ncbi:MAG: hydantoinase B/oxoprolinase family protein [Planctomycetales bacterium]|nr:hydantoinase B/oxoprolinase family protein [Planctomycetales bacterium]
MSNRKSPEVEAWVDVGGTFTDCYVRVGNQAAHSCKVLSSGHVPAIAAVAADGLSLYAAQLESDPDAFWIGALVSLLHESAHKNQYASQAGSLIVGFSAGRLLLDRPLDCPRSESVAIEIVSPVIAPVLGIRRLLACPFSEPLARINLRIGTTRGTNALLTRSGTRTAFAVTEPFSQLLEIGDQTRPALFDLAIKKHQCLAETTIEIKERLDARGEVLTPLNVEDARKKLRQAIERGCSSLAICLMHSYLNPVHEVQLEGIARELDFQHISLSSRTAPLIDFGARAQTTVVDAYLSPTVRNYLADLVQQLGGPDVANVMVMTSAGGLVDWQQYQGKDSVLSGPAGGVVALRAIAKATGLERLIGVDMGGTSTDVCLVNCDTDADMQLQYESTKAGVRILTPSLPIETVAAGGGSICWFDGVSLRVGPQSAGALPGPACYGRGGPLTITDLNVFLNRIPASQFPFAIDNVAAEFRLRELRDQCQAVLGIKSLKEFAQGLRAIATEQMAAAVRSVSIASGVDPRNQAIVGFGGAAGQHICEIANSLGATTILDSPQAGMLSAFGMGLADLQLDTSLAVYKSLAACDWSAIYQETRSRQSELVSQLRLQLGDKGVGSLLGSPSTPEAISTRNNSRFATGNRSLPNGNAVDHFGPDLRTSARLEMRYLGTDATLTLAWSANLIENPDNVKGAFNTLHQSRYGYHQPEREIELVAIRIQAMACVSRQLAESNQVTPHNALHVGRLHDENAFPCIQRGQLMPGQRIHGPVVIANQGSTLFVESGWTAQVRSDGTLEMNLETAVKESSSSTAKIDENSVFDPFFRDCVAQRLAAIATQMGYVLQQTAASVNVKQRRDYSCAVFDRQGQLLANAPHVPVHLGAMSETVKSVLQRFPDIRPGDCFVTNNPFRGGSHLPDITVVTPVFDPLHQTSPLFFLANRAHHADVGGIAPGSMSCSAVLLLDEGVLIELTKLVDAGCDQSSQLEQLLRSASYPPRNIAENLADLAAQQAANQRGALLLEDYANATSWSTLAEYAERVLQAAEERTGNFLREMARNFGLAPSTFADSLDDGTPIAVSVKILPEGRIVVDFQGTGNVSPTNFNANPSIVRACVLYVLRCLIADDLPLNDGVLRRVDLRIPSGLLRPDMPSSPDRYPAVAAGNVETSQRIVDVLLGALGCAAASQGTMNNILFGNEHFGFYETIGGGAGATAESAGASAVHTHMTNTRLTDPEILESRYPVRLVEFGVRANSGGAGRQSGGDGLRRTLEFLEDVELSLITSRRGSNQPFGVQGGQPGAAGKNVLITFDANSCSNEQLLPSSCQLQLRAGQRLRIETPGGGGFGTPE